MNIKAKLFFFCMIIVGGQSLAQINTPPSYNGNAYFSTKKLNNAPIAQVPVLRMADKLFMGFPLKAVADLPKEPVSYLPVISSSFYTQNLGFFCKKELQIEKATKIPFKFRLGSVQQCDWLEGKPNTRFRQ